MASVSGVLTSLNPSADKPTITDHEINGDLIWHSGANELVFERTVKNNRTQVTPRLIWVSNDDPLGIIFDDQVDCCFPQYLLLVKPQGKLNGLGQTLTSITTVASTSGIPLASGRIHLCSETGLKCDALTSDPLVEHFRYFAPVTNRTQLAGFINRSGFEIASEVITKHLGNRFSRYDDFEINPELTFEAFCKDEAPVSPDEFRIGAESSENSRPRIPLVDEASVDVFPGPSGKPSLSASPNLLFQEYKDKFDKKQEAQAHTGKNEEFLSDSAVRRVSARDFGGFGSSSQPPPSIGQRVQAEKKAADYRRRIEEIKLQRFNRPSVNRAPVVELAANNDSGYVDKVDVDKLISSRRLRVSPRLIKDFDPPSSDPSSEEKKPKKKSKDSKKKKDTKKKSSQEKGKKKKKKPIVDSSGSDPSSSPSSEVSSSSSSSSGSSSESSSDGASRRRSNSSRKVKPFLYSWSKTRLIPEKPFFKLDRWKFKGHTDWLEIHRQFPSALGAHWLAHTVAPALGQSATANTYKTLRGIRVAPFVEVHPKLKASEQRIYREARNLAAAIDAVLDQQPKKALDILCQRLKGVIFVAQASNKGTAWTQAEKLELLRPEGQNLQSSELEGLERKK